MFNDVCMKRLLHSIQSLHYFEKRDVCKYIKSLLEHLEFKIVDPVPISEHFTLTEGFFIGIEKHRPPSIPIHIVDAVISNRIFDAFRIFDDFVNDLIASINIDNNKTKFAGFKETKFVRYEETKPIRHPHKKKLFLVLTYVDEYYISIMQRCIPSYTPVLFLKTLNSMKRANLPESVLRSLQKYYTIVVDELNDPDIPDEDARAEGARAEGARAEGGGSKSRRKNSHKSKAKTHRHRRGSKSKSKSRRRSHSRARKHKKYTRRH